MEEPHLVGRLGTSGEPESRLGSGAGERSGARSGSWDGPGSRLALVEVMAGPEGIGDPFSTILQDDSRIPQTDADIRDPCTVVSLEEGLRDPQGGVCRSIFAGSAAPAPDT